MLALVRLLLIVAVAAVAYYIAVKIYRAMKVRQLRPPPICPRCENSRNVIVNNNTNSRFPRREYAWYCKDCGEGFQTSRMH